MAVMSEAVPYIQDDEVRSALIIHVRDLPCVQPHLP